MSLIRFGARPLFSKSHLFFKAQNFVRRESNLRLLVLKRERYLLAMQQRPHEFPSEIKLFLRGHESISSAYLIGKRGKMQVTNLSFAHKSRRSSVPDEFFMTKKNWWMWSSSNELSLCLFLSRRSLINLDHRWMRKKRKHVVLSLLYYQLSHHYLNIISYKNRQRFFSSLSFQ